jgi:hypothetical protein
MSDSGDIIRASVDAAGGRWETTVRDLRDAFGMSRLTAKGRRSIVAALEERDLRIDPGLVGTRLDDPVAVIDVRPVPEPPAPEQPAPAAESRRRGMILTASGLAAISLIAAILVGTTGGGDAAPPIGPAATAVAAGAASAGAPLVAARVAAERATRRHELRIARLQREYSAAIRLARAGRYTAARDRMRAVGRFRDARARTRLFARAARAHR